MSSENNPRVSTANHDGSQSRPRKKRKWDQPAESLVAAGVATIPGVVPFGNVANCTTVPTLFQAHPLPQSTGTSLPKSNQPKIQDELIIAREIVINDAEPSLRYKLTKRQTQEEIQKCTGAVVITRGKYRLPNAAPDGERPLYLHISAGAHLKDTAERILAVDCAAAMVEEMLKQGPNLQPSLSTGVKELSTCVFLGFDADPSLNIAARIRGPNDQYINHIMNETGATVVLKGCGSGISESPNDREAQQQLHLVLSANNPKSLDDAKRLAENLLGTISIECASRFSSCKVYNAVPPPQHLLAGVQGSVNEQKADTMTLPEMKSTRTSPASSVKTHEMTSVLPRATAYQSVEAVNSGHPQSNIYVHPRPLVNGGTSYNGYAGIYPQATPLQQVALALRQSTSPLTSTVAPATSIASMAPSPSTSSNLEKEKRHTQRRKFQELPVGSKGTSKAYQGPELSRNNEKASADSLRNVSTVLAPKKTVQSSSNGMPPPPPQVIPRPPSSNGMPPLRTMPPPPPPPRFSSLDTTQKQEKNIISNKSKSVIVPDIPDTLVKLMEYGEEDDDPDETCEESDHGNSAVAVKKPFWAL
ncbi:RS2-interacting KH protein [Euphorbia peplus]|nr:RS2-interacting KH protein [Euphorbia peplus]